MRLSSDIMEATGSVIKRKCLSLEIKQSVTGVLKTFGK
jgi:hypothetical protein